MYADFASEHSPKWSSGKLPLSGGRGGIPFAGTDAKLAMGGRERGGLESGTHTSSRARSRRSVRASAGEYLRK